MVRDLFYDLFTIPAHLSKAPFWKKLFLKWRGVKPSLALRLKFYRDTQLKFKDGATIKQLNFEALSYIQKNTHYFNRQIIKENKRTEKRLLKASWLDWYPHEVTQIRVVNSQKEEFSSKLHHGGPYRGDSLKNLRSQITELCFSARKKGLVVEEIEITHTHPCIEAVIEDGEESSFIFNGLSASDIELGKTLAPFIPYPLRVKAITPIANYSMLF